MLLHTSFFYCLEEFLKKCCNNRRDNFFKCWKSSKRKKRSRADAFILPICKLFTHFLFLNDSILIRLATSNVIYNSQLFRTEADSKGVL